MSEVKQISWAEVCRFDIAFKDQATLQQFEKELGYEATDGSWGDGEYIATFRPESERGGDTGIKLVTLFLKYKEKKLVEEASSCQMWVDVGMAEKLLRYGG